MYLSCANHNLLVSLLSTLQIFMWLQGDRFKLNQVFFILSHIIWKCPSFSGLSHHKTWCERCLTHWLKLIVRSLKQNEFGSSSYGLANLKTKITKKNPQICISCISHALDFCLLLCVWLVNACPPNKKPHFFPTPPPPLEVRTTTPSTYIVDDPSWFMNAYLLLIMTSQAPIVHHFSKTFTCEVNNWLYPSCLYLDPNFLVFWWMGDDDNWTRIIAIDGDKWLSYLCQVVWF